MDHSFNFFALFIVALLAALAFSLPVEPTRRFITRALERVNAQAEWIGKFPLIAFPIWIPVYLFICLEVGCILPLLIVLRTGRKS
jgi:hypothetical protein